VILGVSTVCAYCNAPLLDAQHARDHVATKCTQSTAYTLRRERDEALSLLRDVLVVVEEGRNANTHDLLARARAAVPSTAP